MTGHSAVQLYDEESVARCKCASAVNHNCRVYDFGGGKAQESRDYFIRKYVVVLIQCDIHMHTKPTSGHLDFAGEIADELSNRNMTMRNPPMCSPFRVFVPVTDFPNYFGCLARPPQNLKNN